MTLGPPCKSFVWINSHTHGRTEDEPWGDESKSYVNLGSMLLIWFFWFEWNPCVNCYSRHAVILKEGDRLFFWWLISEASFTGPALDHSCNRQRGTGIPRTARVIPHEVPTRVYSNWQADQPVLGWQILEGAILVRNSIENGALGKNGEFISMQKLSPPVHQVGWEPGGRLHRNPLVAGGPRWVLSGKCSPKCYAACSSLVIVTNGFQGHGCLRCTGPSPRSSGRS